MSGLQVQDSGCHECQTGLSGLKECKDPSCFHVVKGKACKPVGRSKQRARKAAYAGRLELYGDMEFRLCLVNQWKYSILKKMNQER